MGLRGSRKYEGTDSCGNVLPLRSRSAGHLQVSPSPCASPVRLLQSLVESSGYFCQHHSEVKHKFCASIIIRGVLTFYLRAETSSMNFHHRHQHHLQNGNHFLVLDFLCWLLGSELIWFNSDYSMSMSPTWDAAFESKMLLFPFCIKNSLHY